MNSWSFSGRPVRHPFPLDRLPRNGIYFFYEDGEIWGHGGDARPRIVRIGTHRDGNFRSRMNEHFLLSESSIRFDATKSRPHDRSIFRKNLGRPLLARDGVRTSRCGIGISRRTKQKRDTALNETSRRREGWNRMSPRCSESDFRSGSLWLQTKRKEWAHQVLRVD